MARKLTKAHVDAYKEGGNLSVIFKSIISDPELSFEIRRNDEVFIYYNKKKILSVKSGKTIKPLSPGYYKGTTGPAIDISNPIHWKRKTEIDRYFQEAKFLAYRHSLKQEFQLQQNVSFGNRDCNGRFLVVDMEWQLSQEGVAKEDSIKITRPDLVIVDLKPNENNENNIYLAEVKLGTDALYGPSGLQGHVNSTHQIICSDLACCSLIEDVDTIIKQKYELGLFTGKLPKIALSPKPKMMFILGHRGEAERKIIQAAMSKLDIPQEIGEPIVMYHDTLIKL